ncbi:Sensor histidine kinase RcsC [Candidatus Magnetaquicoccaceae bacterium FCR-1]|uniref:histidine kinase n=1 Tax=Candidatus Magnetaquiglobus chichijimensis TaxID=3141448 RepID=A0ABQ0C8E4_9PROT
MALDLKKFITRFVEEARDHIRQLGEGVASLESGDAGVVHAMFRSAHTIKGSARMLKLDPITETAHRVEDFFASLREGRVRFQAESGECLRQALDALSAQVDILAETPDGARLAPSDPGLLATLIRLAAEESPSVAPESVPAQTNPEPVVSTGVPERSDSPAPPGSDVRSTPLPPPPSPVVTPDRAPSKPEGPREEPRLKNVETVRVRLEKLDELIKLMGELLSSHARMRQRLVEIATLDRQLATSGLDGSVTVPLHLFAGRLREDVLDQESLMTELHDKTLMMRMLPLAVIFEPAQRLARDLARSVGKQAMCQTRGAEIELDRRIIDKLSDPLIHVIRNAIDHGLETPDIRLAAGKPAQGRLTLSARQESGQVVIEIQDDGAGISLERIRAKALRMGLVNEERVAALTERETLDLIFLPGFSTTTFVTDLSGRGVGMDVVRQTVLEELRGAIEIDTVAEVGTTLRLRVPFSLAMMRVLLVEVNGAHYGFTARHVGAIRRLSRSAVFSLGDRDMVILGNEFVPLLRLSELLDAPGAVSSGSTPRTHAEEPFGMLVVVLAIRDEKLALEVDDLVDEHDMVIHPMPELLRMAPLVSGLVVTGENALVSVLHAPGLLERARRLRGGHVATIPERREPGHDRVLVVDDSLNTREIEKDMLEACGFRVTLAEDGLDGLRHALAEEFDAVLTDVEMPGMDGFSLTERLRREDRYRDKPIIILTSRDREEDKQRGMRAGADAYIVKGDFSQGNLVDTLRTLLGWRGHGG